MHAHRAAPSPFFLAEAERVREAARLGPVLDLACGAGRHALAAAALGARVVGMDRDAAALAALRRGAVERGLAVSAIRADLERPHGIPAKSGVFGAILVFRFLFRPLAPAIVEALRPGGLLLYETFTTAQPALGGGPRNPAFLLTPGELPRLFAALEPLRSEEAVVDDGRAEALARLVARRR